MRRTGQRRDPRAEAQAQGMPWDPEGGGGGGGVGAPPPAERPQLAAVSDAVQDKRVPRFLFSNNPEHCAMLLAHPLAQLVYKHRKHKLFVTGGPLDGAWGYNVSENPTQEVLLFNIFTRQTYKIPIALTRPFTSKDEDRLELYAFFNGSNHLHPLPFNDDLAKIMRQMVSQMETFGKSQVMWLVNLGKDIKTLRFVCAMPLAKAGENGTDNLAGRKILLNLGPDDETSGFFQIGFKGAGCMVIDTVDCLAYVTAFEQANGLMPLCFDENEKKRPSIRAIRGAYEPEGRFFLRCLASEGHALPGRFAEQSLNDFLKLDLKQPSVRQQLAEIAFIWYQEKRSQDPENKLRKFDRCSKLLQALFPALAKEDIQPHVVFGMPYATVGKLMEAFERQQAGELESNPREIPFEVKAERAAQTLVLALGCDTPGVHKCQAFGSVGQPYGPDLVVWEQLDETTGAREWVPSSVAQILNLRARAAADGCFDRATLYSTRGGHGQFLEVVAIEGPAGKIVKQVNPINGQQTVLTHRTILRNESMYPVFWLWQQVNAQALLSDIEALWEQYVAAASHTQESWSALEANVRALPRSAGYAVNLTGQCMFTCALSGKRFSLLTPMLHLTTTAGVCYASAEEAYRRAEMMKMLHLRQGSTKTGVDNLCCWTLSQKGIKTTSGVGIESMRELTQQEALELYAAQGQGPLAESRKLHAAPQQKLASILFPQDENPPPAIKTYNAAFKRFCRISEIGGGEAEVRAAFDEAIEAFEAQPGRDTSEDRYKDIIAWLDACAHQFKKRQANKQSLHADLGAEKLGIRFVCWDALQEFIVAQQAVKRAAAAELEPKPAATSDVAIDLAGGVAADAQGAQMVAMPVFDGMQLGYVETMFCQMHRCDVTREGFNAAFRKECDLLQDIVMDLVPEASAAHVFQDRMAAFLLEFFGRIMIEVGDCDDLKRRAGNSRRAFRNKWDTARKAGGDYLELNQRLVDGLYGKPGDLAIDVAHLGATAGAPRGSMLLLANAPDGEEAPGPAAMVVHVPAQDPAVQLLNPAAARRQAAARAQGAHGAAAGGQQPQVDPALVMQVLRQWPQFRPGAGAPAAGAGGHARFGAPLQIADGTAGAPAPAGPGGAAAGAAAAEGKDHTP